MKQTSQKEVPQKDWRKRVAALSTAQKRELAQRLQQLGTSRRSDASQRQKLVAYVVTHPETQTDPKTLTRAIKDKLPAYMVPSSVMVLPSLPRTANGKIDVRALPTAEAMLSRSDAKSRTTSGASDDFSDKFSPPRTPTEEKLCEIWCKVLGINAVGIHDNFFELGGDSILSIQIVSQAREAGLRLAPNQLFEQPTVAELAAAVNLTPEVSISQDLVTGPVPLTPIQHWFFELGMVAPQHWHQAMLLSLPAGASSVAGMQLVQKAIATLWRHHDVLRLRFIADDGPDAMPTQLNATADTPPKVVNVNLSTLDADEQQRAVAMHGQRLHASVNLEEGNLFQAAHFLLGENKPSWLLLSLHHLAVDAVSWHILEDDLRKLLSPLTQNDTRPVPQNIGALPAKTTSFKFWAETLVAQAEARKGELAFWLEQLERSQTHLPTDIEQDPLTPANEGTAQTVSVVLDTENTQALLSAVPKAYRTQVNEILLTALSQTLLEWIARETGEATDSVKIEVEAHGREQLIADIDVSRTVGWFTTTYPICLQLSAPHQLDTSIKSVKEQLRQVPDRGIGYGMLRYLADKPTRQQLAEAPPAEVLFNYLGQHKAAQNKNAKNKNEQNENEQNNTQSHENHDICLMEGWDVGALRDERNCRDYLLEINAWVTQGQLHCHWSYDTQRYHTDKIARLAERYLTALQALIEHCSATSKVSGKEADKGVGKATGKGGFTPSDFPSVAFSQTELDRFLHRLSHGKNRLNVETIYPLAPLQQAFLWHGLQTSVQSGLLHVRGTLHGQLDRPTFQQAWKQIIARHGALRTAVYWEDIKQPVQVVNETVQLPWQYLDWRTKDDPEQAIADFLEQDRTKGFNLTQAPILRLALIQLSDNRHELIWTCHHLMLDGWSGALVINQMLDAYNATINSATDEHTATPTPANAPSYESYIQWLYKQDAAAAQRAWQQALAGFTEPTPLPVALRSPSTAPVEASSRKPSSRRSFNAIDERLAPKNEIPLSEEATVQLKTFLTTHRLTLNTLLQGLWSIILSECSGQSDVLFGATVSGRQADLAGIESVVGLLINVLPVRVQVSAQRSLIDWLQVLQTKQAKISAYAYASPTQIQSWSECSERLFNSLLVIENYPIQKKKSAEGDRTAANHILHIENLRSGIVSSYDLTLIVKPGEQLTFHLDAPDATPATIESLLINLRATLRAMVMQPTATIEDILKGSSTIGFQASPSQKLPSLSSHKEAAKRPVDSLAVLPKNSLELTLAQIWKSVLNAPTLTTQDNFFDLGGDSLRAVQLFNAMQQQLNCTLPLATLFQAPTVQKFAALLSKERSSTSPFASSSTAWSSLVPIQPHGSRRPFFFHGGSADALTWARFSQLLGTEQPFYALQRPDLDGSTITDATVESLATACIQEIKTIQLEGPYVLGGHCFGGAVAYEIARQLEAQGDAIAALIQIDAYCPNAVSKKPLGQLQEQLQLTAFSLRKAYYYHGNPQKIVQLPKKVWQRLRPSPAPAQPPPPSVSYSSSQSPAAQGQTTADQTNTSQTNQPPTNQTQASKTQVAYIPYEQRYAQAHQSNINASERYHPKPYNGSIHLFRAGAQILDWHYGKSMGWQTVVPHSHIEITTIPGLFGNLFNKKSAPLLAQKVQTYLNTIQ
ncbi:MAG: alpha/beta fold hydrolase [Cyanobacteria bacterium J06632_3]